MKKSLSFLTALMLVLAFIFTLNISNVKVSAEELSDEEIVQAELNNITVPETAIIDFPVVSVSAHGATIKWESNNESVLDVEENGGWVKVTRPTDEDKVVTLKVTLTLNNASDSRSFEVKVLKGVTVTNEYSINYVLNGGSNNPNNPTKYKVGQNPVINAPTKGTVEFLGWYLNDSFTGEKVTSLPKGTSGDVTLYAKWAPATLVKIEITTQPTKLVYNALETFDASGIKVTAIYNDNHEEDVTSKVEYDKQQLHGDDTEVVVSYMGQTAKVAVTVNKLTYDLSGITFDSASKQYNGEAQTLAYSGTLPQGLSATVEGVATNVSEGAVTIKLVFTNSNERDYVTPEPIEKTLTITKAPLTITADSKSMKVGATLPELTISYEGFKGNDNKSVLSVLPSVSTNATSASPAGQYAITITKDATASNYEITFVDGVLSINEGSYTIEATSSLKVTYSGSAQSFTAVVKDGANPIDVELTYTLNGNPFTGATNVGSYNVLVSYDDETYGKGSTTITFVVEAKALEASMFEALPEVSYTGSAHQPKVNGTYNNKALVEGTDYSLSYENNIEKGTAHVIVNGLTNYSGEVIIEFTIGASDLERVTEAKDSLQDVNVVAGATVPTSHENGSAIFWASTSTALSVNENGVVTTVQTNVEQEVVVYAIITKGNAAEYAKFTVTVPASSTGDAPVVGESVVTNSDVTVSNIPTELGVKGVTVVETEQEGYAYAYDIKLVDANNQEVELNGAKVTVKLPGTFVVGKVYQVYHIGVTEEMVAEVTATSTEYIEFETTHFSVYAVKEVVEEPTIQTKTVAEMIALEVSEIYYQVTGVVKNIKNTTYGNFDLVDETGSIYVYGLLTADGENQKFESLNISEGDTLTLIGQRGVFGETIEIVNAYYVSHTKVQYTVDVEFDSTKGDVQLSSNIVNSGEEVSITVTPKEGYVVNSVTVNEKEITGSNGVYKVTVNANTTVVVEFIEEGQEEEFIPLFENNTVVYIATVRSSGNYFIMSSDLGTASTKRYQAVDSGTVNPSEIKATADNQAWTIIVDETNKCYYLKSSEGKYVSWTSGNSGALSDEQYALNISLNDDGTYVISSVADSTRKLQLNNTSGNNYFAFYGGTQAGNLVIASYAELDDETKLVQAINALEIDLEVESEYSLPTTGLHNAVISWEANPSNNLVEGKLVNDTENDVVVNLTATVVVGTLSDTATFQVTINGVQQSGGEDTPTESGWVLVTDVNELKVGDQIVIVGANVDLALSTTQNNNNRGAATVTKSDNTVSFGDDVQVLTIENGNAEGTLALYTGSGYLYAASTSSNHLKTKTSLDSNGSWNIEITSEGIATIKSYGNTTKGWLRFNPNNGSPIFSCYGSGQQDIQIYKYVEQSSN